MDIADLRAEIVSSEAKAAFDRLVEVFAGTAGLRVEAHEQGFLNSLRIYRGEDFCFAAVPNDEWVLAYIRRPELRRGQVVSEQVMAILPDARLTNQGEITLRIRDVSSADRWLAAVGVG